MNTKPSKEIMDFMEQYSIDSDEIWPAPGGKTWVIKHKALERVAAEQKITFERPDVVSCSLTEKSMVICVFGKMGDREEWTFGEASPANNKNQYFAAMTEKRAKDRVILKLLAAHGDLYSEEEADEFKQKRKNPHVNRAEDFYEEISTEIPETGADAPKMKVKDARPAYEVFVKEMRRITDSQELLEWGQAKALEINSMPGDWPQHFRAAYADHKKSIAGQAA